MLCSVSGDKPSGSTWLDRLRSSRGLSGANDDDAGEAHLSLDHFLRRNYRRELAGDPPMNVASDDPPSAPTPSNRELTESPREEDEKYGGDGEWYGVMSDVLSELFNFGGATPSSTISRKKFRRKQPNPRHCPVEAPNNLAVMNLGDSNILPGVREFATTSLNSDNKKPAPEKRERRRRIVEPEEVEEEEKGERDLVGYSRSEVTVIDTSFEIWKSEKLVFRRKSVWKVRDKKGKSRIISAKKKKKRKCSVSDDEIGRKNKKMKTSSAIPNNNPQNQEEDVYEDLENDIDRVHESRFYPRNQEKKAHKGHPQAGRTTNHKVTSEPLRFDGFKIPTEQVKT
ncbi:PREDICTED: uncharacterized protein LOC104798986 [Tarenaya hassleriana]|uniref:uncharacterized protein LOC104798986 n=1 Tax=Tarenaya hassleriana TaxID=28532 RepID=UPI00053C4529|nr:PREDICTED: uncharacterized protein LOC104798986 [Tarenaya hassleriana]